MASGKNTCSSRSSVSSGHEGHRERLRLRAQMDGVETLRPHELIELLLYYALPRRDVNALAHDLERRFGGVRGVLTAAPEELARVPGMGMRAARVLGRIGNLCAAYGALHAGDRPQMGNLHTFRDFAGRYRRQVEGEETWQFCLTYEGRLLLARPIAPGTAWAEPEYLRGALADVISSHARGVLLAQFVETARPAPDDYDLANTRAYARTLRQMEVPLLDHLLVGGEGDYSMRDRGDVTLEPFAGEAAAIGERYMAQPPTWGSPGAEEVDWLDFDGFDADQPQI